MPTSAALLPSQTDDLELKKLVYLYLINYAKTQPDLAIMGVNTFVKVCTWGTTWGITAEACFMSFGSCGLRRRALPAHANCTGTTISYHEAE